MDGQQRSTSLGGRQTREEEVEFIVIDQSSKLARTPRISVCYEVVKIDQAFDKFAEIY